MKRLPGLLKASLLIFFSSLITLFLGELLVRIFLPQDKMVTWIEMHQEGFVMNQSGGSAFQELGERRADYRFNSNRLRGPEVSSSPLNVLTIGDSFTFGLLINEEDTYINHLQEKVDSVSPDSIRFLNAAVGGSGLADWPGWLEHLGEELSLDYLIYFMNNDDINRALSKNLYIIDESNPDSLIKSQRWKPRSFMIELGKKDWYRWLQGNSELANIMVKLLWKQFYFEDLTSNFDPESSLVPIPSLEAFEENSEYSVKLGNELLNEMDSWCVKKECELLIVTTGFFEKPSMSVYDQKFYNWIQTSHWQLEGKFWDNTPCIQNRLSLDLDEIKIPGDGHPDEKGSLMIADCSWEWLQNKLLN